MVFIQSEGVSSESESPFGAPQQGTATGSGFVVDNDGTIITNAHVVEGADSVQVRFDENGEFVDADVKGVDTSTDIAVLKIDPSDVSGGLTPIPLGDSSKAQVGDPVIAIGNPSATAARSPRASSPASSARSRRPTASRSPT